MQNSNDVRNYYDFISSGLINFPAAANKLGQGRIFDLRYPWSCREFIKYLTIIYNDVSLKLLLYQAQKFVIAVDLVSKIGWKLSKNRFAVFLEFLRNFCSQFALLCTYK